MYSADCTKMKSNCWRWKIPILAFLLYFFAGCSESTSTIHRKSIDRRRIPIIYVYTVVSSSCRHGVPSYIKTSLEQAVHSQPDANIIIASNFGECLKLDSFSVEGVIKLDTSKISSNRTNQFLQASSSMFQQDSKSELWITSALRFFIMEDIMRSEGFKEIIHVEVV